MLTRLIEMVSFILAKSLETEEDDWGLLRSELTEQLEGRGFKTPEIDIAFEVANRIRTRIEDGTVPAVPLKTNLVYQVLERLKISREAQGYLMSLVHNGSITPQTREEIVERAFYLDGPELGLEEMQYIVNMVLSGDNWPGEDSASMSYVLQ